MIPRPQVFVDRHYLLNKKIIIQNQNDQVLEYDLSSEDQWPLKNSLLIFSYTLVHCLDRPHLMDKDIWEKTIKFYFCKENNSVLKYEITSSPIKMVTAYVGKSKQSMQLVREVKCLN